MTDDEINSMTRAQLFERLSEIKAELLKLIAAASAVGGCQTREDAERSVALVKESKLIGTKLGLRDGIAEVR